MTPADEVIERFLAMFGDPKTGNPELFLVEYRKALTGYGADLLRRAADRVMKTATFWPKPAELLEQVNILAANRYGSNPVDWDAVEAERRKGWSFADVDKAIRQRDPAWQEEHAGMMAQWRNFMKGIGPPVKLDGKGRWIKPELTERSKSMSSDRSPTGEDA